MGAHPDGLRMARDREKGNIRMRSRWRTVLMDTSRGPTRAPRPVHSRRPVRRPRARALRRTSFGLQAAKPDIM
jgi:hypothetical protein